ncbi:MAG TPA: hypothetical protein VF659_04595 [Pyrinomonadaceae bacterium]|jgi:hypothetical protein
MNAGLRTLGDEFVEGVFEEEAFEAVAGVARRASARGAPGLFGVAALVEDAEREAAKERARAREREVDGVVGEGADLKREAGGVPRGVRARGGRVVRVVEVDREVEQRCQTPGKKFLPGGAGTV